VSYSKLRDMFQQSLNRTLHGHLQSVRADQAKAMLADRAVSVKEVARRLNFSSEHYFSRFFRRATGLTPTQFRLAR
jgi:two-component system response regulator YesN